MGITTKALILENSFHFGKSLGRAHHHQVGKNGIVRYRFYLLGLQTPLNYGDVQTVADFCEQFMSVPMLQ